MDANNALEVARQCGADYEDLCHDGSRFVCHMTGEQLAEFAARIAVRHGINCRKVPHCFRGDGYLHMESDDGPYDVDGVTYCGRCHAWIGTEARVTGGDPQNPPEVPSCCGGKDDCDVREYCLAAHYRVTKPAKALHWSPAPNRTDWGAGMMVADIAVTPDSTATIFCEARDAERLTKMLADGIGRG